MFIPLQLEEKMREWKSLMVQSCFGLFEGWGVNHNWGEPQFQRPRPFCLQEEWSEVAMRPFEKWKLEAKLQSWGRPMKGKNVEF